MSDVVPFRFKLEADVTVYARSQEEAQAKADNLWQMFVAATRNDVADAFTVSEDMVMRPHDGPGQA